MKKRTWMKMGAIAVAASLIMAGCGSQSTEKTTGTGGQEQEAAEAVETDAAAEEQEVRMANPWVEITEEEAVAEQMYNPGTEIFTGPDLSAGDYMTAIKNYLAEEVAAGYEEADYMIPEIYIVATDESVERDIKIWGDFWVMNYDADGDTLKTVSGGSYPGCFHVAKSDGVYDVTAFDVVADGSDYDSSAKEIFGEYYEDFVKLSSDDTGRNKERAKQISEYVKENGLSFTQYQDYGWDPVVLP